MRDLAILLEHHFINLADSQDNHNSFPPDSKDAIPKLFEKQHNSSVFSSIVSVLISGVKKSSITAESYMLIITVHKNL